MNEISVLLKRLLNEKYGSAYDNPDIFTDEIKKVIRDVMNAIRDGSYLVWEKINIADNIVHSNIFWLKKTEWMEGVLICLWPGNDVNNNGKSKASYFDGQIEDSGKMTAVINLFNVVPKHCEDIYYDYFIHEFKHAYFDYTKMKSGKVKYKMYGDKKIYQMCGKRFSLYDDELNNTQFNLKDISYAELLHEYKNNKEKISKDVLFHLLYISSDTETAAYAESVALEIIRCAKLKWSIEQLKKDSIYTNIFLKLNMIMDKIEKDFTEDDTFRLFLENVCRKYFHTSFRKFWSISRKNIQKQISNIRKTISLYY